MSTAIYGHAVCRYLCLLDGSKSGSSESLLVRRIIYNQRKDIGDSTCVLEK